MPRFSPNQFTRVGLRPAASPTNTSIPDYLRIGEAFTRSEEPLNGSVSDALSKLTGIGAQIGAQVDEVRKIDDENRAKTDGSSEIKNAKDPRALQDALNKTLVDKTLSPEYRVAYRELLGAELGRRYDASLKDAMDSELKKAEAQDPNTGLFYQPRQPEEIQSEVWKTMTEGLQPEVAKSVFFRGALHDTANGSNLINSAAYSKRRNEQLVQQTGLLQAQHIADAADRTLDAALENKVDVDWNALRGLHGQMATELYQSGHPEPAAVVFKGVVATFKSRLSKSPHSALTALNELVQLKVGPIELEKDPRFAEDIERLRNEARSEIDRQETSPSQGRKQAVLKAAQAAIFAETEKGTRELSANSAKKLRESAAAHPDLLSDSEKYEFTRLITAAEEDGKRLSQNDRAENRILYTKEAGSLALRMRLSGKPEHKQALIDYIQSVAQYDGGLAHDLALQFIREVVVDRASNTTKALYRANQRDAEFLQKFGSPANADQVEERQFEIVELLDKLVEAEETGSAEIPKIKEQIAAKRDEVAKQVMTIRQQREVALTAAKDYTKPFDPSLPGISPNEANTYLIARTNEGRKEAGRIAGRLSKIVGDVDQGLRAANATDEQRSLIKTNLQQRIFEFTNSNATSDIYEVVEAGKPIIEEFTKEWEAAKSAKMAQDGKAPTSESALASMNEYSTAAYSRATDIKNWGSKEGEAEAIKDAAASGNFDKIDIKMYTGAPDTSKAREEHKLILTNDGEWGDLRRKRLEDYTESKSVGLQAAHFAGSVIHIKEVLRGGISMSAFPSETNPEPKINIGLSGAVLTTLDPSKTGFFFSPAEMQRYEHGYVTDDPKIMEEIEGLLKKVVDPSFSLDADIKNNSAVTSAFFRAQGIFYGLGKRDGTLGNAASAKAAPPQDMSEYDAATAKSAKEQKQREQTAAESKPASRPVPVRLTPAQVLQDAKLLVDEHRMLLGRLPDLVSFDSDDGTRYALKYPDTALEADRQFVQRYNELMAMLSGIKPAASK